MDDLKKEAISPQVLEKSYQLENFAKKRKLEKANDFNFANLPELVLMEIFKLLNFKDGFQAKQVCQRWHDVLDNLCLWPKIDVEVKNPYELLETLLFLPSCVKYLKIRCITFDGNHPLWLPDILCRLHQRCPNIEILILDNICLSQRYCNVNYTTDHVLHLLDDQNTSPSKLEKKCRNSCCSNTNIQKIPQNAPRELSILSIRYSRSFMSHLSSQISPFIPNIKVLDLTDSTCLKNTAIQFLYKLTYLEELYLVQCPITNCAIETLLKYVKTLKVLDLEGSRNVNDETYEILQKYGYSLEKLFLGNTGIQLFFPCEGAFKNLQMLCLKNTALVFSDIQSFIEFFPSLKWINVTFCQFNFPPLIKESGKSVGKEILIGAEGDSSAFCHHFFQNKYM